MIRTLHRFAPIALAMMLMHSGSASAEPRCYVGIQTTFGIAVHFGTLDLVLGCVQDRLNGQGMNQGFDTQLVLGPSRTQLRANVLTGGGKNMAVVGGGFDFATQRWLGSMGVQIDGLRGYFDHQFDGDTSISFQANGLTRRNLATAPTPAPPPLLNVPQPAPATPPASPPFVNLP